jgi:hypothetical protein
MSDALRIRPRTPRRIVQVLVTPAEADAILRALDLAEAFDLARNRREPAGEPPVRPADTAAAKVRRALSGEAWVGGRR